MPKSMKKSNLLILLFFSGWNACNTKVVAVDIIIYNNDTLYIEKYFNELIQKKIQKQPDFKSYRSIRKNDNYCAFWEIKDDKMYLIKVTNNESFSWDKLKYPDTLDLKKAFGKKYKSGKVSFNLKNKIIYVHKRFVLRQHWQWPPTYIEDYLLEFKNNILFKIDTITNYRDEKFKLNRYSYFQLREQLFEFVSDSIIVNSEIIKTKKIRFNFFVEINNIGTVDTLGVSNIYDISLQDSVFEIDSSTNLIQLDVINRILVNTIWDEVRGVGNERVNFEFEYDFATNTVSNPRVIEYFENNKINELARLPWFIRRVYSN
jgi:hypothetical protein